MLEHLFNCHGEWTYLLSLIDSFPMLRYYLNGQILSSTNKDNELDYKYENKENQHEII